MKSQKTLLSRQDATRKYFKNQYVKFAIVAASESHYVRLPA
jgi:hypothetical protein